MTEVTIISEEEIPHYQPDGGVTVMIAVTYTANDRPPRTVWIDKPKYSDAVLRQAIRSDMEKAAAEAPRKLEL